MFGAAALFGLPRKISVSSACAPALASTAAVAAMSRAKLRALWKTMDEILGEIRVVP
jgi:hypothetical protein